MVEFLIGANANAFISEDESTPSLYKMIQEGLIYDDSSVTLKLLWRIGEVYKAHETART